jgi:hypothetical protein
MHTSIRTRLAAAAAATAFITIAGTAQAATVSSCLALIGKADITGAWKAVQDAGDANPIQFLGNKTTQDCSIKEVGTSTKGKPRMEYKMAGPMTADECSMYNHLSSTDSKLNQAKVADALAVATSTVDKVNTLYQTGKLIYEPGYTSLFAATEAVRSCIAELATP